MKLQRHHHTLQLTHRWTIANKEGPGGGGGTDTYPVVVVSLHDEDGTIGWGEAAPSSRYQEDAASCDAFLERIDPQRLSFNDLPGSLAYINALGPGDFSPKGAMDIALNDGAAKRARKPIHDFLHLPFEENRHLTCFSIGIDSPERIREKVLAAMAYPALKLKVGDPRDFQNLAALREVAPTKPVRVDANEAWTTREQALHNIERLAQDRHIEFVEQPMPADSDPADLAWLKDHSPLPLFADESCLSRADVPRCRDSFHGVNVKLMKTGGITGAKATLEAARAAGLKTMIGCMIESSVLISAGAHLAALADYLDLDGNLLIENDPFAGVTAENGWLSFASAVEKFGLRARPNVLEGSGI